MESKLKAIANAIQEEILNDYIEDREGLFLVNELDPTEVEIEDYVSPDHPDVDICLVKMSIEGCFDSHFEDEREVGLGVGYRRDFLGWNYLLIEEILCIDEDGQGSKLPKSDLQIIENILKY